MKAIVEKIGPQRAQVYVKDLAPQYILVPVEALPTKKNGEELELVFRSGRAATASVDQGVPPPQVRKSPALQGATDQTDISGGVTCPETISFHPLRCTVATKKPLCEEGLFSSIPTFYVERPAGRHVCSGGGRQRFC